MPNEKSFQKSVQICLSKLKKPSPAQLPIHPNSMKTPSNWFLSRCRHLQTSSFTVNQNQSKSHKNSDDDDDDDDNSATLTDIDQFLHKNFNSLYCKTNNNNDGNKDKADGGATNNQRCEICSPRAFHLESPRLSSATPDIRPSNRFFVSPSASNSLQEQYQLRLLSGDTASITMNAKNKSGDLILPDESIAVLTYTRDPLKDFRKSMEEMVRARLSEHEIVDWDFMEELLFSYLELNEKKSYKYILGAFVDLVVILRQNSGCLPGKPRKIKTTRREKTRTAEKRTKETVT